MLSQEENSPGVLHSLQQHMGSKEIKTEADTKAFSIRQYVLASRHRNILNCWPFPEKYLQLCLNHGLKDVLPPIEMPTTLTESLKGCSTLNCSQDANNADFCKIEGTDLIDNGQQNFRSDFDFFSNEETSKVTSQDCPLSHKEGNHHNCNVSNIVLPEADTFSMPSSTYVHKNSQMLTPYKTLKHKWRRRKGKYCKKKSMVEILAAAKHCTVEDLQRINKLCYIGSGIEGCHQMAPHLENNSKSEITDEGTNEEAKSDQHEVANADVKGKAHVLLRSSSMDILSWET